MNIIRRLTGSQQEQYPQGQQQNMFGANAQHLVYDQHKGQYIPEGKTMLDDFFRFLGLFWVLLGLLFSTGLIDLKEYSKPLCITWAAIMVVIFIYIFARTTG